jgi:hypothetical protein
MEGQHKTKKESWNKEVIHASLQVSKHKAATLVESPPLNTKEEEMIPRQKPDANVADIREET